MSQSGLTDASREAAWSAWYVEHLRIMRTVAGISSAQRMTTRSVDYPPSLAMYSVVSESVFRDPYYQSIRGMGEWLPLIDKRYYRRNLFGGMDEAPVVAAGQRLVVVDRDEPDPSLPLTWLQAVGLDKSTPFRGIAVVDAGEGARFEVCGAGIYAPMPE